MLKRFVSVCVVLSALMGMVLALPEKNQPAVSAVDTISELEKKQQSLIQKSEEYQAELDKTQKDIEKKEAYQESLLGKIETVNELIVTSQQKIDEITKQINSKEKKIKKLNADIDERIDTLRGRIKTIYMSGDVSSLEIILGAKDFGDFLDKCELIRNVSNYDEKLVKEIQTDMDAVNKEKKQLQKTKKTQEAEQAKLKTKREELQGFVSENKEVLETLYTRNKEQEDAIKRNKGVMTSLDDEIKAYYDKKAKEAAKKAAEMLRKQQEAEAKKKAQQGDNTDNNPRGRDNGNSDDNNSNNNNNNNNTNNNSDSDNTSSTPVYGGGAYVWPCPGHYTLSSYFGEDRGSYGHGAVDISDGGIMGTTVVAADAGTVIVANNSCTHNYAKAGSCGCGGGYGNYVWIDHGNGKATIYAHLTRAVVSVGQTVSAGEVLGYVGTTGWSTGPHLHYECRLNGVRYDPMTEY